MAALPGATTPFSFVIKQGADWPITMTWLNDAGAPLDLSNYSMSMSICPSPGATPLLTINSTATSGSRIILGGTAGTIELFFAHADTAAFVASGLPLPSPLPDAPLMYRLGSQDLKYVDPSGLVDYLFEGSVFLAPRSTV